MCGRAQGGSAGSHAGRQKRDHLAQRPVEFLAVAGAAGEHLQPTGVGEHVLISAQHENETPGDLLGLEFREAGRQCLDEAVRRCVVERPAELAAEAAAVELQVRLHAQEVAPARPAHGQAHRRHQEDLDQPLQRYRAAGMCRLFFIKQAHAFIDQLLAIAHVGLEEQGFLGLEEVMDHALVDPGQVGDLAQRAALETVFGEQFFRRAQDGVPAIGLGAAYFPGRRGRSGDGGARRSSHEEFGMCWRVWPRVVAASAQ
ncbi:MAG: hypothetical protein ABT00_13415 [Bordetella sp. SCN 68-11]|nr:MAG: hypothetical protein ABT00_13415 [Bordetella sp. SCN 68-11]OJW87668.1 MAG: hypothetical protein BGO71_09790 [Burkholderiales bacterium 67-32]